MASRYSLTIQIANPSFSEHSPGHTGVAINTPTGQTYAGFGPKDTGPPWFGAHSPGQFDFHTVRPGETPPRDFSNVLGHHSYATFTIPLSASQTEAAIAEVKRFKESPGNHNPLNSEYCTTTINRIMEAAGLGSNLLYSIPSRNIQYLSDIKKALALDSKANSQLMEPETRGRGRIHCIGAN